MLPAIKRTEPNWVANLCVAEDEKHYHIELAAPGMNKKDFHIHVDDKRQLIIQMEKKNSASEHPGKEDCKGECKYLRREFNYARYEQTMQLPDNVDADEIKAKMEDGILTLTLKKTAPDEMPQLSKVIEIE